MGLRRQIGAIAAACILGCLSVWVQNEQIELSYSFREWETRLVELRSEERALRSQLAYLGSPEQLMAHLESDELKTHPGDTRWVLRKSKKDSPLMRLAQNASHPLVRAFALRVEGSHL